MGLRQMDLSIRKAEAGDVAEIAAIWHAGWHQGHADVVPAALVAQRTRAECHERTAKRLGETTVALSGGQIVGFYMIEGDELYQFYVARAFQGQGLAGQLMALAEGDLTGRRAWLACSVGNDRAAAFYRKAGWHQVAIEPYEVETSAGPQTVRIWRFEKDLGRADPDR
ncbi:MAG: GNAT family N-acetyltransferase [Sulfitobacter sp.]|nr:GNAT family N-acetyltransferase [Sulfitobacter sp.]